MKRFCEARKYDDLGFSRTMKQYFPDEWELVIEAKHPKSTMYRIGRGFEYRVRDHVKKLGYYAMRSPASRSPIDVLAIRPGAVLMIQCKVGGALPPKEWNEIYDAALSCGAIPVMATRTGFRQMDYYRLTERKDGSRRKQPMVLFDPAKPGTYPMEETK